MICASAYTVFELMLVFVIGMTFLPVTRLLAEWLIDGRWRKS